MEPSTVRLVSRCLGLALYALLVSCGESPTQAPAVVGVQMAKGGSGPSVNGADPAMAPQEWTLDVRIVGSGFDSGSDARWLRGGEPVTDVVTNSTSYVSSNELVANITISSTATVDLYDVEVTTRRGKKGVGVELFAVQEKSNNGNEPFPDPSAVDVDLSGGMVATGQPGQHGLDAPNLFQLSGQPHGPGSGCDAPDAEPCFRSALQLGPGYLAAGGLAQCTVPRRMSDANRDRLLSKLDAPEVDGVPQPQSRESFDLEFDRDTGFARMRTFWHEPDNPDGRYGYFLDSSDVVETGGPNHAPWQIVVTNGVLRMYGLGDKELTCNWQDSITLTLTPTG